MIPEEKRIHTKEQLREWLAIETARYPLTARHILPYIFQLSQGAIIRRHMVLLRKTEYYFNTGKRLRAKLYFMRLTRLQLRYGMYFPPNTCGKGLYISHVNTGGLNASACVGEYCRFMPYAVVAGDDVQDLAPTIGDHVTLGMRCTVMGGVTLADGITVGAHALVTKSFLEPGIKIAGVPAKKLGGGAQEKAT